MKSPKLAQIADKSATVLSELIAHSEEDILKAWHGAIEEANSHDADPKLKLGFTITHDLRKDRTEWALSFGVRHKITAEAQLGDPSQAELPLEEKDPAA